jgi:hypothetical protein
MSLSLKLEMHFATAPLDRSLSYKEINRSIKPGIAYKVVKRGNVVCV